MSDFPVRRQFIDVKAGQLHLRTCDASSTDSSVAIVCLHMMPKSGRIFVNLMPELAKDRLVIAPDYPGYGESDGYSEAFQPTIEHYAESISEVISHFNLDQVDLIGYHTGSMVSIELAHRYPNLIRKIINISAPVLSEEESRDLDKFFAPIPLDKEGTRFRTMWERIIHFSGPGMTLEMAAVSMAENLRGGERYEDGHHAAFEYARAYTQKISEIKQPCWVMNFGDDLFEYSKRVRTDFPDWSHGALDIWPKEVAVEMLTFLDN